jgi:hypothetical protein
MQRSLLFTLFILFTSWAFGQKREEILLSKITVLDSVVASGYAAYVQPNLEKDKMTPAELEGIDVFAEEFNKKGEELRSYLGANYFSVPQYINYARSLKEYYAAIKNLADKRYELITNVNKDEFTKAYHFMELTKSNFLLALEMDATRAYLAANQANLDKVMESNYKLKSEIESANKKIDSLMVMSVEKLSFVPNHMAGLTVYNKAMASVCYYKTKIVNGPYIGGGELMYDMNKRLPGIHLSAGITHKNLAFLPGIYYMDQPRWSATAMYLKKNFTVGANYTPLYGVGLKLMAGF